MTVQKLKLLLMCFSGEIYICVLLLSDIELIFFIASIVICFGFVMKIVLIAQGHFSYS